VTKRQIGSIEDQPTAVWTVDERVGSIKRHIRRASHIKIPGLDRRVVDGQPDRFRDFRNGLRILTSIDTDEFAAVSVPDNCADWQAFSRDPVQWLVRGGDERAERLWRLIEG
jgi:hypothetical protein